MLIYRLKRAKRATIREMSILNNIFGFGKKETVNPDLRFGRYSDSYKNDEKYDDWDRSLQLFEQGKHMDSYTKFLDYLSDEREGNVKYWFENRVLHFEIFQGSKRIIGLADHRKLRAESKIARVKVSNIGMLRRLLEKNFNLKYTRFAFDHDQNLTMVFTSNILDNSPYKLYYALKELATNSDKQDDILIEEFDHLEPIDNQHIIPLDETVVRTKYKYLKSTIEDAFDEIDNGRLNVTHYPGGASYLLLDAALKIDYLVKPEGFTMELIEKINRLFFSKEFSDPHQKNNKLRKELKLLLERGYEDFKEECYEVISTFGITNPTGHEQLANFVDAELGNMQWYQENKHHKVALAIPGYIVGYLLFSYSLPEPDRAYLHLYMQIMENGYFEKLGYELPYRTNSKLNKSAIKDKILQIKKQYSNQYGKAIPNVKSLNFDNDLDFSRSYLMMLRHLDMSKTGG